MRLDKLKVSDRRNCHLPFQSYFQISSYLVINSTLFSEGCQGSEVPLQPGSLSPGHLYRTTPGKRGTLPEHACDSAEYLECQSRLQVPNTVDKASSERALCWRVWPKCPGMQAQPPCPAVCPPGPLLSTEVRADTPSRRQICGCPSMNGQSPSPSTPSLPFSSLTHPRDSISDDSLPASYQSPHWPLISFYLVCSLLGKQRRVLWVSFEDKTGEQILTLRA